MEGPVDTTSFPGKVAEYVYMWHWYDRMKHFTVGFPACDAYILVQQLLRTPAKVSGLLQLYVV